MGFFKQVEGEAAVVIENGVYRQCDLYTRGGSKSGKLSQELPRGGNALAGSSVALGTNQFD